jgi:ankyrin repeat protein
VNTVDPNDFSPLYIAALKGHTSVVKVLLSYGAAFNQEAILVAAGRGNHGVVDLLIHAHELSGEDHRHSISILNLEDVDLMHKRWQNRPHQVSDNVCDPSVVISPGYIR